jgi:hypothetical protein
MIMPRVMPSLPSLPNGHAKGHTTFWQGDQLAITAEFPLCHFFLALP